MTDVICKDGVGTEIGTKIKVIKIMLIKIKLKKIEPKKIKTNVEASQVGP